MKFVVDLPLAGLAKWLRFCGFDTRVQRFFQSLPAAAPGVYLLTRQQSLARADRADLLVLTSPDSETQLEEVLRRLQITRGHLRFLSRCGQCNEILISLPRDQVLGLVPEHVFHTQEQFHQCPKCRQVFWPGSHLPGIMAKMLEKLD
ncbi:MAG: Mut7-C RNAse domain-containing protein [Desulfobaccales bacterium]